MFLHVASMARTALTAVSSSPRVINISHVSYSVINLREELLYYRLASELMKKAEGVPRRLRSIQEAIQSSPLASQSKSERIALNIIFNYNQSRVRFTVDERKSFSE